MGCKQSSIRAFPPALQEGPHEAASQITRDPAEGSSSPHTRGDDAAVLPPNCWYTRPFAEGTRMTFTKFHMRQRGNVVFSRGHIPVGQCELDALPGNAPSTQKTFVLGRDFVYGMAYLHNTPLFMEHQWRSRVSHYARTPAARDLLGAKESAGKANGDAETQQCEAALVEDQITCLDDMAKTIYDRPGVGTLVGMRVYVDSELVPDRYPTSKSIPTCTATIDTGEAFNNWICVPLVLVGYLRGFLLGTITLYRSLSLNFVEYMLEQSIALQDTDVSLDEGESHHSGEEETGECAPGRASRSFDVRVEVVYGCRSEMNFCTGYIAKGSIQVVMTQQSKAILKSYRDKLQKMIHSSVFSLREQVVSMDRLELIAQQRTSRSCLFCHSPLRFTCTVCGAQLCGTALCVWRPFAGYPNGCLLHKAQA